MELMTLCECFREDASKKLNMLNPLFSMLT